MACLTYKSLYTYEVCRLCTCLGSPLKVEKCGGSFGIHWNDQDQGEMELYLKNVTLSSQRCHPYMFPFKLLIPTAVVA